MYWKTRLRRTQCLLVVGLLSVACLLAPPAAFAQTTAGGVVTSAATGVPVAGVIISGIDSSGETVGTALSGPDGAFRIVLPSAGSWLFSVTHIGFSPFSIQVDTQDGGAARLLIPLEPKAVRLSGFDIVVEGDCPRPSNPQRLVALLQEGRALFETASRSAAYRFDWDVRDVGLHTVQMTERPWERFADTVRADTLAFRSEDPITALAIRGSAETGFVRPAFSGSEAVWGYEFLVPTAPEVFSDAFVERHCFDIVTEPTSTRIGLSFSARQSSEIEYDVEGTLWLPLDAEARPELHFGFTRFPPAPNGQPIESYILPSRHSQDVREGRAEIYPHQRERIVPDERFKGRIEYTPIAEVGWVPHYIELREPVMWHGEEPAQPRCCGMKEAWLIVKLRRSIWRLLALDPEPEDGRR